MGGLSPIAFDIETSGLGPDAIVTVAGFATEMGSWLALNTTGRAADPERLTEVVTAESGSNVSVDVYESEAGLLSGLAEFATDRLDEERHYLTAYHGETWNGGFDLPFVRRVCVRHDVPWPFPDVAYADVLTTVDRFESGNSDGLAGVYDELVGGNHCDPFEDSERAITAHETGDWTDLLLHNLADIERTRELAVLAGRYVSKSDFGMKNLAPPDA